VIEFRSARSADQVSSRLRIQNGFFLIKIEENSIFSIYSKIVLLEGMAKYALKAGPETLFGKLQNLLAINRAA
jgi:hypothetical protein